MTTPKDLPIDEFVRTIPKPPQSITIDDISNFRSYLPAKKVDLKVTPEEIKTLFNSTNSTSPTLFKVEELY